MNDLVEQLVEESRLLAPTILGILVGFILIVLSFYLGMLLTTTPTIKLSEYIQILVLIVIATTLAVSIYVQRQKEKLDESQVFLNSAIDLINKAYNVLEARGGRITTDRVSWVTAARLLTRANLLSSKITLQSHKEIYESEHDFQRHRFSDLLKIDGKHIPVEFFFGTGFVAGSIGDSAYKTLTKQGANWLPVRVVSTIFQFKAFPKGYIDPLDESRVFDKDEMERLWLFDEHGVHDYVVFRKHFVSVSEKVFRSEGVESAVEVSAEEIDRLMPSLSGLVLE